MSIDVRVVERELRVAMNHIERLRRYFPIREHTEIVTGLRNILAELRQHYDRNTPRLQSRIIHQGKFCYDDKF